MEEKAVTELTIKHLVIKMRYLSKPIQEKEKAREKENAMERSKFVRRWWWSILRGKLLKSAIARREIPFLIFSPPRTEK